MDRTAAATAAMVANIGALTSTLKKFPRPSSAPVMRKVSASQRIAMLHGPGAIEAPHTAKAPACNARR